MRPQHWPLRGSCCGRVALRQLGRRQGRRGPPLVCPSREVLASALLANLVLEHRSRVGSELLAVAFLRSMVANVARWEYRSVPSYLPGKKKKLACAKLTRG